MQTRVTGKNKVQALGGFSTKLLLLAAAGGVAFWITDFAIAVSPLGAKYQAAFSISSLPLALVEAFVGGLVIGFFVSFCLLRFFDSISGKKPIQKALILSMSAMAIIEILSTLGDLAHASVYLLLDTGMNVPRFLALGLVIGLIVEKQKRKV